MQGEIYVLHFSRPYRHARHYIGWATKDTVQARVDQHMSGRGSPLVKAAVDAGIEVKVAAVMPGTRDMERHLKNRHDNRGVCPDCRSEWLEKKKAMKMECTLREVREIIRSVLSEGAQREIFEDEIRVKFPGALSSLSKLKDEYPEEMADYEVPPEFDEELVVGHDNAGRQKMMSFSSSSDFNLVIQTNQLLFYPDNIFTFYWDVKNRRWSKTPPSAALPS